MSHTQPFGALPPFDGSAQRVSEPTPYQEDAEHKAKMIRKMLWLGYEMHYDKPRSPAERLMDKKRLCWNHVEAWCKSKHCSVRKGLKSMSVGELIKVLSQFEQVHKSFLEEYKKAG